MITFSDNLSSELMKRGIHPLQSIGYGGWGSWTRTVDLPVSRVSDFVNSPISSEPPTPAEITAIANALGVPESRLTVSREELEARCDGLSRQVADVTAAADSWQAQCATAKIRVAELEAKLESYRGDEPEILPHPTIRDAVIMSYYHTSVTVRRRQDGDVPLSGWVVVDLCDWGVGVFTDLTREYGVLLLRASQYAEDCEQEDEIATEQGREPVFPLVDCTDQLHLEAAQ